MHGAIHKVRDIPQSLILHESRILQTVNLVQKTLAFSLHQYLTLLANSVRKRFHCGIVRVANELDSLAEILKERGVMQLVSANDV